MSQTLKTPVSVRILLAVAVVGLCIGEANGGILFETDSGNGGSLAGDTYTIEKTGLSDGGVTFDATLNVVGSGNLQQTNAGLGVLGGGSDLVNNGESLRFTMSLSNVSGGSVSFDGFDVARITFLGDSDVAIFSLDDSEASTGDNFLTITGSQLIGDNEADLSGTLPEAFSVFAQSGASNSFRLDFVEGQFTGSAAIPEPSCGLFVALVCVVAGRYRQRFKKSPIASQA